MDTFDRFSDGFMEVRERHQLHIEANYKIATDINIANSTTPTKYRKSQFEWTLAFHNGLKISKGKGIESIIVKKEHLISFEGCWDWEGCNVARDQGGDGMGAVQAANSIDGPVLANIKPDDDISHGEHNDFDLCDVQCGEWPNRSALRIARNTHLGPFGSRTRWSELRAIGQEYLSIMSADSCPAFPDFLEGMLDDKDQMHLINEPGIGDKIFSELKGARLMEYVGDEQAVSRFLQDHLKSRQLESEWTEYFLFYFLHVLKTGRLGKSKLAEKFKNCQFSAAAAGNVSNGMGVKSESAKSNGENRVISRNPVDLAFLTFGNIELKFKDRFKILLREPHAGWHGSANAGLRDVAQTVPWEIAQINGKFWDPIFESFVVLTRPNALARAGIHTKIDAKTVKEFTLDHSYVAWNQEQAAFGGHYATRLAALRIKRMLPMLRGWPRRAVLILDDAKCEGVLQQFKQDHENYLWAKTEPLGMQARYKDAFRR